MGLISVSARLAYRYTEATTPHELLFLFSANLRQSLTALQLIKSTPRVCGPEKEFEILTFAFSDDDLDDKRRARFGSQTLAGREIAQRIATGNFDLIFEWGDYVSNESETTPHSRFRRIWSERLEQCRIVPGAVLEQYGRQTRKNNIVRNSEGTTAGNSRTR